MKKLVKVLLLASISLGIAAAADSAASCAMKKNNSAASDMKKTDAAPVVATTSTATKELKLQTTCPIMKGNPIDKSLFVDYKGSRIYLCCGGCFDPVKKDPQKAIDQLAKEGQKPAPIPQK